MEGRKKREEREEKRKIDRFISYTVISHLSQIDM